MGMEIFPNRSLGRLGASAPGQRRTTKKKGGRKRRFRAWLQPGKMHCPVHGTDPITAGPSSGGEGEGLLPSPYFLGGPNRAAFLFEAAQEKGARFLSSGCEQSPCQQPGPLAFTKKLLACPALPTRHSLIFWPRWGSTLILPVLPQMHAEGAFQASLCIKKQHMPFAILHPGALPGPLGS